MSFIDYVNVPILAVNNYLWDQMKFMAPELETQYDYMPIYPLGQETAQSDTVDNQNMVIYYDRLFRYRTSPFYGTKKEQFSYKLSGDSQEYLLWSSVIQLLLDREDDSAKDINQWIADSARCSEYPVYFHSMKVFIPAFAEFRQVSINDATWVGQIYVDVQYHMTNSVYDQSWAHISQTPINPAT